MRFYVITTNLKIIDKDNKTKCKINIDSELTIKQKNDRLMEDIFIKYFNECIYIYNYKICYVVKYYEDINQLDIIQCYFLKMPLPYFETFQRRYNYTIRSAQNYFINFSYVDSAYSYI